jgi:hypothetical protein
MCNFYRRARRSCQGGFRLRTFRALKAKERPLPERSCANGLLHTDFCDWRKGQAQNSAN